MENDENKIFDILDDNHEYVRNLGHTPVMTVLVGSQNYGLATEKSDYDTYTFILPTLQDIATLREPLSKTYIGINGHINVKDIRLALNLLKKTSPNSVEWFATKHKLVACRYQTMLSNLPPSILRCNTANMMNAIGGMAHQLSKRNMSAGKRFSHMLRMKCMIDNYFNPGSDMLSMTEDLRCLALRAKQDPDNPLWDEQLLEWEVYIHKTLDTVDLHRFDESSAEAIALIENLQKEFTRRAACERGVIHAKAIDP